MKIDEPFHYDADPDTVVEMLSDRDFQDRKAIASGAIRHEVSVDRDGAGPQVTITRTIPISGVPDFFSKFVSDTVQVTEVVTWDAASGGAERHADVALTFDGQPMSMKGSMVLKAVAGGTDGRLSGDLKCSIPLVGGKAEKALAPQVVKQLRTEVATGTAYLADPGRRG